jgi:hypothetical protein
MSGTRFLPALLSYGVAQVWIWEAERRLLADAKLQQHLPFETKVVFNKTGNLRIR